MSFPNFRQTGVNWLLPVCKRRFLLAWVCSAGSLLLKCMDLLQKLIILYRVNLLHRIKSLAKHRESLQIRQKNGAMYRKKCILRLMFQNQSPIKSPLNRKTAAQWCDSLHILFIWFPGALQIHDSIKDLLVCRGQLAVCNIVAMASTSSIQIPSKKPGATQNRSPGAASARDGSA